MNRFNVWCEGYACTGERARAIFLGEIEANTFIQACEKAVEEKSLFSVRDGKPYYWGCQMFDNEKRARKTFG